MKNGTVSSYMTRPFVAVMTFLGLRGRIYGIRRGLFRLQIQASRIQLGGSCRPLNIDQAFQFQRLNLRK